MIKKAAVLGAGVMGAAIAAHLANAGIPTVLLDIVPRELTPEEEKQGLTLDHPRVRNRLAARAIENLLKAKPAPLFVPENASLITPGNLEDHLEWLRDADWIIEAVVERLDVKQELLAKVERFRRPGAIVSTNTSGLSVNRMVEGRSTEFKQHFLGTHFFNPPRYMRLLEVIPGRDTLPEVVEFMCDFGERVLGKGVVLAKDTPNFIANRIGTFGMCATLRAMMDLGLSVEEVDALTGRAMLRPKSASFRTLDMVGLDVLWHVAKNMREAVADPAEKEAFALPPFIDEMLSRGWLGDKTGQGFYKKVKGPSGTEIYALDYRTLEYRPRQKASFPSLEMSRVAKSPAEQLRGLLFGQDKGAQFAWRVTSEVLVYTAEKLPEMANDILAVDRAMKWGYNWDLGPFEVWDSLGVEEVVKRLRAEGRAVPRVVEDLLARGYKSFYEKRDGRRYYYDFAAGEMKPEFIPPEVIFLAPLKEQNRVIKTNPGASLIDIGDGVLCLEFHSRANAIGGDILEMVNFAVKEVEKGYEGLVIGNYGQHFSAGANLMLILMTAEEEEWDELDLMIRQFQNAMMNIKRCARPVVAAPHGMALGGGCEVCLHSHAVNAYAETYMGLVEVGVGLLPAGGGCKEMVVRAFAQSPPETQVTGRGGAGMGYLQLVARAFENIATARVSTSAAEAFKLGFLRPGDRVTMNRDRVIYDAKQVVLEMARRNFSPPRPAVVPALGNAGYAVLELAVQTMRWGNQITDHDAKIARKIAYVLTGGGVTPGTVLTEQDFLDLEREAFLSLLGEPKTIERIRHMLATNKPLRN